MSKKPERFIEGIRPLEVRGYLPKDLTEASYVPLKRKSKIGIISIDGYYSIKGSTPIRQIREYDPPRNLDPLRRDQEAVRLARKDGLVQGIWIETIMSEPIISTFSEDIAAYLKTIDITKGQNPKKLPWKINKHKAL